MRSEEQANPQIPKRGLERLFPVEIRLYDAMRSRCSKLNKGAFQNYAGRGISVCLRWQGRIRGEGFRNFLLDMGARPSPDHTVERKNNNLGYSPDNCCWATRKEQCRNKRNNVRITYKGKTLCAIEWAERTGVSLNVIYDRLSRDWPPNKIFTTPLHIPAKLHTYKNETRCLKDWAKHFKFNYTVLCKRIRQGWPFEQAITTPYRIYKKRKVQ